MEKLLTDYDKTKVDIFISYINTLKTEKNKEGKLANYWAVKVTDQEYANIFKKIAQTGLYIDGDSVTLTYRKKIVVTFDYHAYKNKVLINYPESKFDFAVVYDGDDFNFRKESGQVIYSHKMNNPFDNNKKIIGAYGVIKNSKGEFIELINNDDISKFKKSSKMSYIWDSWLDRMVLKSVIKRICSVHFHDITQDIDTIDNLESDPDRASLDETLLTDIDNSETVEELEKIYKTSIANVSDKKTFIEQLAKRKEELNND